MPESRFRFLHPEQCWIPEYFSLPGVRALAFWWKRFRAGKTLDLRCRGRVQEQASVANDPVGAFGPLVA
jgi:hypothetical protein